LDYEHIAFHFQKCHEHGHLFRECPLNNPNKINPEDPDKNKDGYTQVTCRCRQIARKVPPQLPSGPSTNSSFEALLIIPENPTNPSAPLPNLTASEQAKDNPGTIPPNPANPQIPTSKTSLLTNLGLEIGYPNIDKEDQELTGIDLVHLE
jgi:hypothetical protein